MVLVAIGIVLAIGFGAIRGGRIGRLSDIPLRLKRLVIVALAAQVIGAIGAVAGSETGYVIGLAISAAAALAFCWRNLSVAGLAMIGLGFALNAFIVALNSGMPVSIVKAADAGVSITQISAGNDPRHTIAGIGSHLDWLGDDVPFDFPPSPEVVSPGDILVTAGLMQFIVAGMGAGGGGVGVGGVAGVGGGGGRRRSGRHRSSGSIGE